MNKKDKDELLDTLTSLVISINIGALLAVVIVLVFG